MAVQLHYYIVYRLILAILKMYACEKMPPPPPLILNNTGAGPGFLERGFICINV